jgi:hypothetical protein
VGEYRDAPVADVPQDDVIATYYHDVSPELAAEAMRRGRDHPSGRAGREPWPLRTWPDVPTRVLLCREDRLFAPSFLRRVSRERLGITPDEIEQRPLRRAEPSQGAGRSSQHVRDVLTAQPQPSGAE